ncbi:hypothetical protein PHSY_003864 [Pseudozyma hubeiensis SY62]|uniref:Uncharacterized protein n=1 Tax=Pseudozyma hubeiensis (strain SY62) TaxID=1305764 RepID=R9P4Q3_PSEHS|nr:hypothetical protein PHSY_003864 [Pseudozyma hubeiensis SY62]GAC96284.1 hypothetical protein PHSY_003864 [Pseudozyma hubeiensis SY62]
MKPHEVCKLSSTNVALDLSTKTFFFLAKLRHQCSQDIMASLNTAQEAETSSDRSSEASTSYKSNLPDKKTFIATLSGGAFVFGLTGATIYGLRKAKLQALKEAQELAEAAKAGATSGGNPSAIVMGSRSAAPSALSRPMARNVGQAAPVSVEEQVPGSTSALALFKQMNAAIMNPAKRANRTVAPTSVFDDETGALPSVLRKRKPQSNTSAPAPSNRPHASNVGSTAATSTSATATATLPSSADPKIDYSEMDSTLDFLGLSTPVPAEEQRRLHELEQTAAADSKPRGFFDSPVGLSLKAFLIATSIVTFSTLATVELTKWTLGVETMDEFVVAMTKIIPSRTRGEESLQGAAPHMRVVRDQTDLPTTTATASATPPKSVDQALTDLSNASSFEEWISTLKTQLDTERDFEVSRRFSTLPNTNSNDSISTSSKPYTIHSPLEDLESNHDDNDDSTLRRMLSISPVLPSTAFGLGLVSGVLTFGRKAGLVFMAENAHRLPDTVQGWYFYSKTKNYKVLLGAAKGGLKQGARLGVWTTGFCFAERMAELTRVAVQRQFTGGKSDGVKVVGHWTDGALAGVATAGAATALYRLPRASAVRVFQLGLLAGASTGGIRDLQERLVHREIGGVASQT